MKKYLFILLLLITCRAPAAEKKPAFKKSVTLKYQTVESSMKMGIEKVADSTYHYWFRRKISDKIFEVAQFKSKKKELIAESFFAEKKQGNVIYDGLYQRVVDGRVINQGYYKNNHPNGYFWLKNKQGKTIEKRFYNWDGKHLYKKPFFYRMKAKL